MNKNMYSYFDENFRYQLNINKRMLSPISDIIEYQNKLREIKNSPINEIIKYQTQLKGIINSPVSNLIKFQKELSVSPFYKLNKIGILPTYSFINQRTQMLKILNSNSFNTFKKYQSELNNNHYQFLSQFNNYQIDNYLSSIYNQLDETMTEELFEAFEEVNSREEITANIKQDGTSEVSATITVSNPTYVKDLTVEQLLEIFDTRLKEEEKGEPGAFKKFAKDTLNGLSTGLIGTLLGILLIPLYITIVNLQQEKHFEIRDAIQEYVVTTKKYTIDKLEIKKYIKEKGIDEYDYINRIGLIRAETFIREGKSKNAPLAYPNKLKTNSVVSVHEKKGKWLKIQLVQDNEYIEGWVEKSKVVKFKKEK